MPKQAPVELQTIRRSIKLPAGLDAWLVAHSHKEDKSINLIVIEALASLRTSVEKKERGQ